MGSGCFGKLFWRALFSAGAAAAAVGLTRDDQPFPTRLMVVAGFFAMLLASGVLSHLAWLQRARKGSGAEQPCQEDEAQEQSSQ
jgi:hypothetical protein